MSKEKWDYFWKIGIVKLLLALLSMVLFFGIVYFAIYIWKELL